jgi:hypothetical protein
MRCEAASARLVHRAIKKLLDLAKREGVELRQSYLRLASAAIMVGATPMTIWITAGFLLG